MAFQLRPNLGKFIALNFKRCDWCSDTQFCQFSRLYILGDFIARRLIRAGRICESYGPIPPRVVSYQGPRVAIWRILSIYHELFARPKMSAVRVGSAQSIRGSHQANFCAVRYYLADLATAHFLLRGDGRLVPVYGDAHHRVSPAIGPFKCHLFKICFAYELNLPNPSYARRDAYLTGAGREARFAIKSQPDAPPAALVRGTSAYRRGAPRKSTY